MKNKKLLALLIVMVLAMSALLVACNAEVTWGEWELVTAPTETAEGEIKRTASDGSVETYELPVISEDNYTKTVVSEPTCEADGEIKYTVKGQEEGYSFKIATAKLGHAWGEPTYTWNEDNSSCTATRVCSNDATHTETAEATITSDVVAPTFEADGSVKYTATFDKDWAVAQEKVVEGDGKITLTKVAGKPATCKETGLKEYWRGSNGVNYEDEAHTKVIENIDTWKVIPALGHAWGTPTYTWAADYSTCKAKRVCTHNNKHIETIEVQTNRTVTVPATCTKKGTTLYTAKFASEWAINQTKSVEDVAIVESAHEWQVPKYEWNEDFTVCTATRVCEYNSAHKQTAEAIISYNIVENPTCSKVGKKTAIATFTKNWAETQREENIEIPVDPDVHSWGAPSYDWAADYSSVTVTSTCTASATHKKEATSISMSVAIETMPTLTTKGTVMYTPAFAEADKWAETSKRVEIPTLNATDYTLVIDTEPTYETYGAGKYTITLLDTPFTVNGEVEKLSRLSLNINGVLQATTIDYTKSEGVTLAEVEEIIAQDADGYVGYVIYGNELHSTTVADVVAATKDQRDVTFYIAKQYTLTYNYNDGSEGKKVPITYGDTYHNSPKITKDGYVLDGWYTDAGKLVVFDTDKVNPANHTLNANWYTKNLDFELNTEETEYKVEAFIGTATTVSIPQYYKGKPVTEIADKAFNNRTEVTSVTLPATIKRIGSSAFAECIKLENINIPASVEIIDSFAFIECVALTSIAFADDSRIRYIGDGAFAYIDAVTSIEIPASVQYFGVGVFMNHTVLQSIKIRAINGVTPVYSSTDSHGETNTITYIGSETLPAHEVDLMGSILTIHEILPNTVMLFAATGARLPDNASGIAMWAAQGIELDSIEIPASVTKIHDLALENAGLTTLTIASEGEALTIGDKAFASNNLTSIVIPSRVASIGANAFYANEFLASIYLEHNTMPAWGASWNNNKPVYLFSPLPPNAQQWATGNKYWHYDLGTPTLYEEPTYTITYIGGTTTNATEYKSSTADFTLNAPTDEKAGFTFDGWYDKETDAKVTTIPQGSSGNKELYANWIADTMTFGLNSDSSAYELTGYTGTAQNVAIPRVYNGKKVVAITDELFSNDANIMSITIPNTIEAIGPMVCNNCEKLASVVFEANSALNIVGDGAFALTAITSIDIPATLINLGRSVFGSNAALETITVGAGNTAYKAEGNTLLSIDGKTLILGSKNAIIPATVETITMGSFSYSGITTLAIPDSVKTIGIGAFSACTSLTTVTFGAGSQLTTIGDKAFAGCTALTSIVIPKGVTTLAADSFSGANASLIIYLGHETTPEGFVANWNNISPIGLDPVLAKVLHYSETSQDAQHWRYVEGVPTAWA